MVQTAVSPPAHLESTQPRGRGANYDEAKLTQMDDASGSTASVRAPKCKKADEVVLPGDDDIVAGNSEPSSAEGEHSDWASHLLWNSDSACAGPGDQRLLNRRFDLSDEHASTIGLPACGSTPYLQTDASLGIEKSTWGQGQWCRWWFSEVQQAEGQNSQELPFPYLEVNLPASVPLIQTDEGISVYPAGSVTCWQASNDFPPI